MFDEVFGKISNDNLDMVYEFFVKIKDYFEKIFVITHSPLVSQWADSTVKITKENNISHTTRLFVNKLFKKHNFYFLLFLQQSCTTDI